MSLHIVGYGGLVDEPRVESHLDTTESVGGTPGSFAAFVSRCFLIAFHRRGSFLGQVCDPAGWNQR